MCFACFRFCLLCSKLSNLMRFTPLEIWKQVAELLGIHAGSVTSKISDHWSVNLRTCCGFENSWKSPMVITKVQQLVDLTLIDLIEKNCAFVAENQAMIDNDLSKLIRSIARDIGVSKKGTIFIISHEGQEERSCFKAFKQIQAPPPTKHVFFFFCQDQLGNSQNNR